MINTNCGACPFAEKCYMKDNPKRLPWGKGGNRGGAKIRNYLTCTLLPNEPIVQHIKGRKKNCPFMEQVRKELRR